MLSKIVLHSTVQVRFPHSMLTAMSLRYCQFCERLLNVMTDVLPSFPTALSSSILLDSCAGQWVQFWHPLPFAPSRRLLHPDTRQIIPRTPDAMSAVLLVTMLSHSMLTVANWSK